MSADEAFPAFLFLCVFIVLGGAAVGAYARALVRREPASAMVFFLIWGAGFGGIPLLIGGAFFLTSKYPVFFFAQLFMFAMMIVLVALMPPELSTRAADDKLSSALPGAAMLVLGAAIILLTLQDGIGLATLAGAALGFVGAAILLRALFAVLRFS